MLLVRDAVLWGWYCPSLRRRQTAQIMFMLNSRCCYVFVRLQLKITNRSHVSTRYSNCPRGSISGSYHWIDRQISCQCIQALDIVPWADLIWHRSGWMRRKNPGIQTRLTPKWNGFRCPTSHYPIRHICFLILVIDGLAFTSQDFVEEPIHPIGVMVQRLRHWTLKNNLLLAFET